MKVKDKNVMGCSCGYTDKQSGKLSEKYDHSKKTVKVADENQETLPVTSEECSKCGNNKAYYWMVQTRAGDEPETKFLRCTKCRHTWRDYS